MTRTICWTNNFRAPKSCLDLISKRCRGTAKNLRHENPSFTWIQFYLFSNLSERSALKNLLLISLIASQNVSTKQIAAANLPAVVHFPKSLTSNYIGNQCRLFVGNTLKATEWTPYHNCEDCNQPVSITLQQWLADLFNRSLWLRKCFYKECHTLSV